MEKGEGRMENGERTLLYSPFFSLFFLSLSPFFSPLFSPPPLPAPPNAMQIIVVYDITNNKIRTKIADICEDYGLDRVQYSAFSGDLARVHQEEMMEKISHRLGKLPGKIYLYPICEKDWRNRIEISKEKKSDVDAASE